MFRPSDRQATFGSLEVLLSPEKRAYLDAKHWAGAFRRKALPLRLECELLFATRFCSDNGRPNKPVVQVVGLLLFKEMFDGAVCGSRGLLRGRALVAGASPAGSMCPEL